MLKTGDEGEGLYLVKLRNLEIICLFYVSKQIYRRKEKERDNPSKATLKRTHLKSSYPLFNIININTSILLVIYNNTL